MKEIHYCATRADADKMLEFLKKEYAAYPYMAQFYIQDDITVVDDNGKIVDGFEVGVNYAPLE